MNRRFFFLVALGLIVILGIAVRARHLAHPMRYDESYNYLHYASHGPRHIITHYVPNNHILHTLCVWGVSRVAGNSPAALRVPAVLAGVLLIPATAWLAWRLSRRMGVALLAGLGVCCSSAMIEYSTNARGYSMLALFAVLAALSLLYALQSPQQRRRWICWGILGAAGMYTVLVMVLPLLGMTVVSAVIAATAADTDRRFSILRGLWLGCIACILLSVLSYLPVFVTGGLEPFNRSQELVSQILGRQIATPTQMAITTLALWARHASLFAGVIVCLGFSAYVLQAFRRREPTRWILLGVVVVPIIAAIVTSAPLPARTWLFALPFLFAMVALGLAEAMSDPNLPRRIFGHGLQIVAALVFIASLTNVWKSSHLCSEPGGLVLVEPALEECKEFGDARCALVSPYTPATAYYKSRIKASPILDASSPDTQRVYILTSNDRRLDDLWRPGVKGFELFELPQRLWEHPGGTLYVADRTDRNALR